MALRAWFLFGLCVVAAGCGGGDSEKPVRTLITFTKIHDPGPADIRTARADGTGQRRLVRGVGPAVSPDGRWIAFDRCDNERCDLWVIPATGGDARLLARGTYSPEWSPTSDRIVTSRAHELTDEVLFAVDPRTGDTEALARGALWGWSISPSGVLAVEGGGAEPGDRLRVVIAPYREGRLKVVATRASWASWNR